MTLGELRDRARTRLAELSAGPRPVIRFGLATCGLAAGAAELVSVVERELANMGAEAELVPVGCIGTCYLEPLMDIQKPGRPRVVYGQVTPEKACAILQSYLMEDDPKADLALGTLGEGQIPGIPRFFDLPMLKPQVRIVTRNLGIINPEDIDHYLAAGGYQGLERALSMAPEAVIEEVVRSGLRGRGGAGFPTGQKWRFARQASGSPKYLVCNAAEGDIGAFTDRVLLESDPQSVLEGMAIAARACGANKGYVYIRSEYESLPSLIEKAISQAQERGLLGRRILGSEFDFQVEVFPAAGCYVCGEETALINSVEGKRGVPRLRPPFPVQAGLWGRPTVVNNVKTLASLPLILRQGADWFLSLGTGKESGTAILSLSGSIVRPGVVEVPLGMPLQEVIYGIGGGIREGKRLKAVQTGGPLGGVIPASMASTPTDFESMKAAGSPLGSGGVIVMDEDTCMVDVARRFLDFAVEESCGHCTLCRLGTVQMREIMRDISAGQGKLSDLDLLSSLGEAMIAGSFCAFGQGAPGVVLSTIKHFREDYEGHILRRRCLSGSCPREGDPEPH